MGRLRDLLPRPGAATTMTSSTSSPGRRAAAAAGSRGWADTIADGKVTVPAKCWKVVAVVEGGAGGTEETGVPTRLIAVVMPNVQAIGHGWAKYRVSVDAVEELTGYHFFDRVSAIVIGPLKAMVDTRARAAGPAHAFRGLTPCRPARRLRPVHGPPPGSRIRARPTPRGRHSPGRTRPAFLTTDEVSRRARHERRFRLARNRSRRFSRRSFSDSFGMGNLKS